MFVRSLLTGLALLATLNAQRIDPPVVEINGRAYTGLGVDKLVESFDFYEREMARVNLPEALKYYAFRERLAAEAEKAKLAEQSPYKEELSVRRVAILMQAQMDALKAAQEVRPEQARAYYDEHKDELEQLRFKLLFVSFGPKGKPGARSQEEAKARIEEIKRKLDAGALFTDMVKQYSDAAKSRERGGDYATPITRTTTIPGSEEVVPLLFGLLPGKISEPVQVSNGFDLFQVTERKPPSFENAKDEVYDRLRTIARAAKLVEMEKSVQLKLELPEFFGAGKANAGEGAPSDLIVAKLDGHPVTVAEVGLIADIFPASEKERILQNKEEMLRKFGLMSRLAAQAEAAGFAVRSPYKERLATARVQTLAQAQTNAASAARVITPEDQRKFYDAHQDDFTVVRATGIYIPFGNGKRTEADARARAEEFLRQVKQGGEVGALIQEYSEDPESRDKHGDLGTISKAAKLPDEFKNTVFALQPGHWSAPLQQPSGFYVIRAERNGLTPYDEVKEQIYRDMQQEAFNQYITKLQHEVQFKILDPQYFAQRPGGKFL